MISPMSPADNEEVLVENFSVIPDPHERLAALVTACAGGGLADKAKCEANLVPGCVSRVWLTASVREGRLALTWDADSPLVRGLAGLVCRVYHDTAPEQAAAFTTAVLDRLGLTRQISPTRLNGLAAVGRRIRELAVHFAAGPVPDKPELHGNAD